MRLFGLFALIFIMWSMIMIVSYFLIFIIGPFHINVFNNSTDGLISSIVKASLVYRIGSRVDFVTGNS